MTSGPNTSRSGATSRVAVVIALMALAGTVGWFAHQQASPVGNKAAVEKIVRDTILANPEILPEALENLQRNQARAQLATMRAPVQQPFPGAVLGNPNGAITLVEFTDFACGYCRKSVADIEALTKANPDLRIVVRELPIISPHSAAAAKMALAAAEQGKYKPFHDAMFAAGQIDPATIEAAARKAGLDLARAKTVAESAPVTAELQQNLTLAQKLGFSGTPSWVVGDELIAGAVGVDRLAEAVKSARKN